MMEKSTEMLPRRILCESRTGCGFSVRGLNATGGQVCRQPTRCFATNGAPGDAFVFDEIGEAQIEPRLPPNRGRRNLRLTPGGGWHRLVRKAKSRNWKS